MPTGTPVPYGIAGRPIRRALNSITRLTIAISIAAAAEYINFLTKRYLMKNQRTVHVYTLCPEKNGTCILLSVTSPHVNRFKKNVSLADSVVYL